MKIMVSACLSGENCKYNGGNNRNEKVLRLMKDNEVITVCPEQLGGLPTPRVPSEIVDGVVTTRDGENVDAAFRAGAAKCLEIAMREKPELVVLQSRSPSCGVKQRYDGTFTGRLTEGAGVTARMLMENGFWCVDVEELTEDVTGRLMEEPSEVPSEDPMEEIEVELQQQDETLRYYEDNADSFAQDTISADMSEARRRFMDCLPEAGRVLDFGCGSGRDTKFFLDGGFAVDAADGSAELCRIASAYAGIEVKQMLFQELDAAEVYDGIWACASILHLPKAELADVLHRIARALKDGGVLYTSFKYGMFEGLRRGRYFTDFTEESLRVFLEEVPELMLVETWITQDVRPGREAERWINLLARRV